MNRGALPRHSVRSSSTPPGPPAPLPVLHNPTPKLPPNNYPPQPYSQQQQYPHYHQTSQYPNNFLPSNPAHHISTPASPPSLPQPQLSEPFLSITSQKPQSFPTHTPNHPTPYTPASHGNYTPVSHLSYTPSTSTTSSHSFQPANNHSSSHSPSNTRGSSSYTIPPPSPPPSRHNVYTPPPPAPSLILESVFNSEKAFEDVKKTIASTIRNASSPLPTTNPFTPIKQQYKGYQQQDFNDSFQQTPLTTMQLTSSMLTNTPTPPNNTHYAEPQQQQQVKSVKSLVSKFTTQLQSAASSKNTSEFIDLLSRFSSEYAFAMKNEEAFMNNGLSGLGLVPANPFGIYTKNDDYATPDIRVVNKGDNPQNSAPMFTTKTNNENVQVIKEMQEMATVLKDRIKARIVDKDQKIQQISEDILTLLKAQYVADMQATSEHYTQKLQHIQDRHLAELRSNSERYERKIQDISDQYENSNQQLRERMLSGAGAGEEAKRENAQLRAQLGTLQLEIKTLEERLRSVDDQRKDQRRKDLLQGVATPSLASQHNAKKEHEEDLQELFKEIQEKNKIIEELQAVSKERESIDAIKETHAKMMAKKEQDFSQKLLEMENMNKALRSSIQQMHERNKK